jgi:hypothetical protein
MAAGIVATTNGFYERALGRLQFARAVGERIGDQDLTAVANYYLARCYRKLGKQDDAAGLRCRFQTA